MLKIKLHCEQFILCGVLQEIFIAASTSFHACALPRSTTMTSEPAARRPEPDGNSGVAPCRPAFQGAHSEPFTMSRVIVIATFSGISGLLFGYDLCVITSVCCG